MNKRGRHFDRPHGSPGDVGRGVSKGREAEPNCGKPIGSQDQLLHCLGLYENPSDREKRELRKLRSLRRAIAKKQPLERDPAARLGQAVHAVHSAFHEQGADFRIWAPWFARELTAIADAPAAQSLRLKPIAARLRRMVEEVASLDKVPKFGGNWQVQQQRCRRLVVKSLRTALREATPILSTSDREWTNPKTLLRFLGVP